MKPRDARTEDMDVTEPLNARKRTEDTDHENRSCMSRAFQFVSVRPVVPVSVRSAVASVVSR